MDGHVRICMEKMLTSMLIICIKNLFGNPEEITHKTTRKMIYCQLDIKQKQFTKEVVDGWLVFMAYQPL